MLRCCCLWTIIRNGRSIFVVWTIALRLLPIILRCCYRLSLYLFLTKSSLFLFSNKWYFIFLVSVRSDRCYCFLFLNLLWYLIQLLLNTLLFIFKLSHFILCSESLIIFLGYLNWSFNWFYWCCGLALWRWGFTRIPWCRWILTDFKSLLWASLRCVYPIDFCLFSQYLVGLRCQFLSSTISLWLINGLIFL